jgi:hypothetical protein
MQQHQFVTANGTTVDQGLIDAVTMTVIVLGIISYFLVAYLLMRIFKKVGVKQWIAFVPVYNVWKLLEIGGQSGYWSLLSVVAALFSYVSIAVSLAAHALLFVFIIIAMHTIGKRFGKQDWFVFVAIFLPLLWLIWLGFDKSKWQKTAKKPTA